MKMDIPQGGKISKDAKECMQECASELLSFITSEYPLLCWKSKCMHHVNKSVPSSSRSCMCNLVGLQWMCNLTAGVPAALVCCAVHSYTM